MNKKRFDTSAGEIIRMRVSYDGRDFVGSQRQANARTVQGELERALEEIAGKAIPIHLAGRTDRGVHAAGQAASCSRQGVRLTVAQFPKAMNDHLGRDIAVQDARLEPLGFHARYSATWREYRYRIWTGIRQPNAEGYVWGFPRALDLVRMADAAGRIAGEHDFASFASGGEGVPWSSRKDRQHGSVRVVRICAVRALSNWWGATERDGRLIEIRIVANGFLPRMVRGIVGTLVEIGRGARPPELVDELFAAKDRRMAPKNVPAEGLTLWAVGYGNEQPEGENLSAE
ncbi:MAG: tRNA pseudouridine(38-40) synthase TruA [Thermomicrobiales bacterium]|nr:tRNA pseudouridine(38-40) synthase TruA [Thermomicrobiales bacterium]